MHTNNLAILIHWFLTLKSKRIRQMWSLLGQMVYMQGLSSRAVIDPWLSVVVFSLELPPHARVTKRRLKLFMWFVFYHRRQRYCTTKEGTLFSEPVTYLVR